MAAEKNVRKISYRSTDAAGQPVPCLALQGKFLEDYGFYRGCHVFVFYERGKITVSMADELLRSIMKGGGDDGQQQTLYSGANHFFRPSE